MSSLENSGGKQNLPSAVEISTDYSSRSTTDTKSTSDGRQELTSGDVDASKAGDLFTSGDVLGTQFGNIVLDIAPVAKRGSSLLSPSSGLGAPALLAGGVLLLGGVWLLTRRRREMEPRRKKRERGRRR